MYSEIIFKEGQKGEKIVNDLKLKIKDIIIKTIITGQPLMSYLYRTC